MAEQLKGLAFPAAVTPEQSSAAPFSVSDRADLAVAAYSSLGLVTDKAEVLDDFTLKFQALHDALASEHVQDEFDLEPFIGIDLTDTFGLMALKAHFDEHQKTRTFVDHPIWDQILVTEMNRRTLDRGVSQTTSEVRGQALAMILGGDRADAPGLFFTGKNLKDQIKAVKAERIAYNCGHTNTERLIVNPSDTFMINAQRRETGQELLDRTTFSRYVQIDKKSADGLAWVPLARSDVGLLRLRRSDGVASSYEGVRLLAGQKQPKV